MTDKFSRWSTLFSQNLSRDWKKILIWLVGVTAFSGGFVPAFEELTSGQGFWIIRNLAKPGNDCNGRINSSFECC